MKTFKRSVEIPRWFSKARELAKREWEKHGNSDCNAVYLTNPAANRDIDNYIKAVLWPTAKAALEGTEFRILRSEKPSIGQEWNVSACRAVSITLEDPKRPLNPGHYPPWYCSLDAHCFAERYKERHVHLRWYFSASFSRSCDWSLIVDLLKETSHHGISPQLSISDEPEKEYHIVFEGGGSGGLSPFKCDTLEERIKLKLRGFCEFAETVYELEADCSDRVKFRKLIQEVNRIMDI